jgi:hypothetical protein
MIQSKKIIEKIKNKYILLTKQPSLWLNNNLLYCSSHLFLIPLFVYVILIKKTRFQTILFSALYSNFIFSIAFWYNPIKHSMVHKIDAIAARTSIILMLIYTLSLRNLSFYMLFWYFLNIITMLFFFYMSNVFSSNKWCCVPHIICHFMSHVFACIGVFFIII